MRKSKAYNDALMSQASLKGLVSMPPQEFTLKRSPRKVDDTLSHPKSLI